MIKMVYTPIGIIIGEKINANAATDLLELKEPRIMQMNQNENGTVNVNIVPMLGKPKGFEIGRGAMNYDCNDENILKAYKESVTGVSIIQRPPLVDSNGKAMQ
jgi:hypothetical protein